MGFSFLSCRKDTAILETFYTLITTFVFLKHMFGVNIMWLLFAPRDRRAARIGRVY
jgi:hypothetical protein